MSPRPRILYICGSVNMTRQMLAVSAALPEADAWFSPYYGNAEVDFVRWARLIENTIAGHEWRNKALDYLRKEGVALDIDGHAGPYDLVVTSSDVLIPKRPERKALVAVQEGILDNPGFTFALFMRFRWLPLWLTGTAATGLSGAYDRYCVASEGYKELFIARGVEPERVAVTGIPNFDHCHGYLDNDFPHHGYVLVCTSDARETYKRDDRPAFIRRAVQIAQGRQLIFKLHPNERVARATHEIRTHAPGALIYVDGNAEEMVANCSVYIGQYSTLAFVARCLGKEVYTYHPLEEIDRLMAIDKIG